MRYETFAIDGGKWFEAWKMDANEIAAAIGEVHYPPARRAQIFAAYAKRNGAAEWVSPANMMYETSDLISFARPMDQNGRDEFAKLTRMARNEIAHKTDGPVTIFVMVSRALELARAGRFAPVPFDGGQADPLAEALDLELADRGIQTY